MRGLVISVIVSVVPLGAAFAQDTAPPQCRYDSAGQIDYQACLDAAPRGSPWRSLSLLNLGTRAFRNADYANAVRYYDEAHPGGGEQMYSDAAFHAYYAAALHQVGRPEEALVQARRALAVLRGSPEAPEEVRRRFSSYPVDQELVYAAILPVLHGADDPETQGLLATYLTLPARDWVSWANRASVFLGIGELEAALQANSEAMRLESSHPAVLNNQCYILVSMDRASEGLPYCERAVQAAPNIAAVRHSIASAYAALGRCGEAGQQLAEARRLDPVSLEYQNTLACAAD